MVSCPILILSQHFHNLARHVIKYQVISILSQLCTHHEIDDNLMKVGGLCGPPGPDPGGGGPV